MHPLGELHMPRDPALPFQMPPKSSPLIFTCGCSSLIEGGNSRYGGLVVLVVGAESSNCIVVVSSRDIIPVWLSAISYIGIDV
jgi:hypothetical protein